MFYVPKKYAVMSPIFFNPYDVEDMVKAICRVLADESLRRSLIEKGKERVKFFDSEKAINQYVRLYKEVLSRNQI